MHVERGGRRIAPPALVMACGLLLVAGCASGGSPQSSTSSAAGTAPTSSVGASASVAVPPPSGTGSGPGAVATLRGTVTEGVESACVVLVDASGAVLANLQGWDLTAHPLQSEVEVTGTFEPDLMTTCQQGTPFEAITVVSR